MKNRSVNLIIRIISWVLLIQVINISIDPSDPVSDKLGRINTGEDLSINDIESIYELFSELCLGLDIPENDEDDESGFVKVIDFCSTHDFIVFKNRYSVHQMRFFAVDEDFNSIVLDLTSPPPKVA